MVADGFPKLGYIGPNLNCTVGTIFIKIMQGSLWEISLKYVDPLLGKSLLNLDCIEFDISLIYSGFSCLQRGIFWPFSFNEGVRRRRSKRRRRIWSSMRRMRRKRGMMRMKEEGAVMWWL